MRRAALATAIGLLSGLIGAPVEAQRGTWRPAVMTDNGMVASGHALASEAGMRVLRAGGNAADAAIAAWFVQGLVEPGSTGMGGDMFALVYLAKTNEVKFINGTGPAAMAASIDFYKSKGGIPTDGPLSVEVPGAVGGATLAVKSYGTKPLSEVLAPAIELAEKGYPISDGLGESLQSQGARAKLGKFESTKKIWFRDGEPLGAGDRVVNPDIARTFRAIAERGHDGFYRGPVAKATADYLKAHGGIITEGDLAAYRPHEDTAISVNYRGVDVYECPPNSQGHVMLQALNVLEGYDLKAMGHNSPQYLHVVTEALKLAFADRNKYVGDPKFVPPIPMKDMLSKEYAAIRRKLIDPNRALQGEPPPGDPRRLTPTLSTPTYADPQRASGEAGVFDEDQILHKTTYLAVVDKDRNMVSITSSLLSGFGSGMVVEGAGFFLNDRMRYFYLDPNDVNALAPGKRTRQTINPQLALRDGKPYMAFGTPGADTQPQTQLQFFLNVVEFGMNVQEALEQAAVISYSFRDSYDPHNVEGTLLAPSALGKSVLDGLAQIGHKLDVRNARGVGSVKAIIIHPRTGVLMGGVSPTRDSYVMGY
jgi:gamma-glutamyltranspeptidase/glutathione hydrolase